MTIEEIIVRYDLNGLFEHDKALLYKLTKNQIYSDYRFMRDELAVDYICLYMDSKVNLNNFSTKNDFILFIESKGNEYSDSFIQQLKSVVNNEFYAGKYDGLDLDENLFLKRIESILDIRQLLEYDAFDEMLRIMEFTLENLKLDIAELDVGIEL